jgi:hypothetical protein
MNLDQKSSEKNTEALAKVVRVLASARARGCLVWRRADLGMSFDAGTPSSTLLTGRAGYPVAGGQSQPPALKDGGLPEGFPGRLAGVLADTALCRPHKVHTEARGETFPRWTYRNHRSRQGGSSTKSALIRLGTVEAFDATTAIEKAAAECNVPVTKLMAVRRGSAARANSVGAACGSLGRGIAAWEHQRAQRGESSGSWFP